MKTQFPRFRHRKRAQIVEQARHHLGLLQKGRELVVVARVDAIEHRLDIALDDRQGRAKLVGDVGEERAALRLILPEPFRHPVKRHTEVAHFRLARRLDSHAVVPGGDPVGRGHDVGHRRDRPTHAAADVDAERGKRHQHEGRHEPGRTAAGLIGAVVMPVADPGQRKELDQATTGMSDEQHHDRQNDAASQPALHASPLSSCGGKGSPSGHHGGR